MGKGNRIRGQRAMFIPHDDGGGGIITGTGMQIEAPSKFGADPKDPGEGIHLWTISAVHRVLNPENFFDPTAGPMHFDMENLLTIVGPICWKCEFAYSEKLAAKPCEGSLDLL